VRALRVAKRFVRKMSSRPGSVRSFTVDASSAGSDTTRTTPPPSSPT